MLINEGIEYFEIPKILKNYHVGVVLYKAVTLNYKYNSPNKIFEYLACGLDVWISDKLLSVKHYINEQNKNRILQLNMEKIQDFCWQDKSFIHYDDDFSNSYYYENVYPDFIKSIF